jgi:hypothetical protein
MVAAWAGSVPAVSSAGVPQRISLGLTAAVMYTPDTLNCYAAPKGLDLDRICPQQSSSSVLEFCFGLRRLLVVPPLLRRVVFIALNRSEDRIGLRWSRQRGCCCCSRSCAGRSPGVGWTMVGLRPPSVEARSAPRSHPTDEGVPTPGAVLILIVAWFLTLIVAPHLKYNPM